MLRRVLRPLEYSWALALTQGLSVIGASYWVQRPPSSGITIVAVGFVAIVMTVRAQGWKLIERIVWLVLATLLSLAAIRAVQREDYQHDQEVGETRKEETAHFETVLLQNQTQFQKTVSGLAEDIKAITGVDSFCYFTLTSSGQIPTLVHQGKYTLYDLDARFVDQKVPFVFNAETLTLSTLRIGDFPVGSAQVAVGAKFPYSPTGQRDVNIFFGARNGFWTENYHGLFVQGKWAEAIRVLRHDSESRKDITIFQRIDKSFPREKNGSVGWE